MSVLIFDTETTDKNAGEVIEAAWLRIRPEGGLFGNEPDRIPELITFDEAYSQRFYPSKPLTFGSIAVHHILPHELVKCPPSADFRLPEDCEYLIGHSIDFDWEAIGKPKVKRICTHAMAQWIWPDATGYSQTALIYMLLGPTELTRALVKNAHGAATDVSNNLTLLDKILAAKPEIRTWLALWEYSEKCRIPRTCPMKKHEGVLLADLDRGFIFWCLRQEWLDPYFRKGLEQVLEQDDRDAGVVAAPATVTTHSGAFNDDIPF